MYIPRIYIGLFFYVTLNLLQRPDSIADKPMQQGCKGFAAALPKPCSMQGDTFMASQADYQATRPCTKRWPSLLHTAFPTYSKSRI